MLIREAKLEDYSQIYSLNLKHNLNIPNKEEWTKIWNENQISFTTKMFW